jgi:hypothetical protein
MMKYIPTFLIAAVLLAVPASAQNLINKFYTTDASAAFRVQNISQGNDTITVVIQTAGAGAANTVSDGTTTTTIDGSGGIDTIATFTAAVAASADANSALIVKVDANCALSTDSTDGELLSGSYTVAPGKWVDIPWDTSAVNYFSTYFPAGTVGGAAGGKDLIHIHGSLSATGIVTTAVYADGVKVYEGVDAAAAGATGIDFLTADTPIPTEGSKSILIRSSAVGTAATGGIGAVARIR